MRASAVGDNATIIDRVVSFCWRGAPYLGMLAFLLASSAALFVHYAGVRYQRDAARLVLEGRLDNLDSARWNVAVSGQLLRESEQNPAPPHDRPYLVISIKDRRLWYKQAGEVLMTTRVATGSGKTLVKQDGASIWRFDTPRGRLTVQSKEEKPVWVPPDWFYVEQARKRKLALVRLEPGQSLPASGHSVISVSGTDLVRDYPGGRRVVMKPTREHDIVLDGKVLEPPLGTNQRRFEGVLGTHRLNLGNGYALHGTNLPETVGQAVSHGCVRLLNEDIAKLYRMVSVGTPVYLY
jgi:lipoprotein-anchoring transpeptidase ErfK/SrfK